MTIMIEIPISPEIKPCREFVKIIKSNSKADIPEQITLKYLLDAIISVQLNTRSMAISAEEKLGLPSVKIIEL